MNKTIDNIIQTIRRALDTHDGLLHEERLEISIPQGFYRYAAIDSDPAWDTWESVDVHLTCSNGELEFSITLAKNSHAPDFEIIEHVVREEECITEYRVKGPANLTMRDAKRLLVFWQSYFRGFDYYVKTKPPQPLKHADEAAKSRA